MKLTVTCAALLTLTAQVQAQVPVGAGDVPPPPAPTRAPAVAARPEEAWRIALLVANNRGAAGRAPLRYAEDDAGELAAVLTQLGGFRPGDVQVLRGGTLADARGAFDALRKRIVAARPTGRRVVLLFFFSGHSDGQSLELGTESWAFGDVRRELQALGAEIRITIIDSCRSGALLTQKGGTPGPTFDIRFTDDLATSGEAILTSSAAHEMALESREIRASFFSHHFVSGLRGAADASGDGRVTLGEAYRYAFVNTLLATSNTLSGPQHPGYDFRLAGQGELVLTDLLARGAKLSLPRGFERIFVADQARHHLFEVTDLAARRIAVPAGRYLVQGWRQGRMHRVALELKEGDSRELGPAELVATDRVTALGKGDDLAGIVEASDADVEPVSRRGAARFGVGGGVIRGAADALPWIGALRLEASFAGTAGFLARLDLARGGATGFHESAGYLGVGYFRGLKRGAFAARAGWQVSAGPIVQTTDDGGRFWTAAAGTGPWLEATVAVAPGLAAGLNIGAQGMVLRRDDAWEVTLWPAAAAMLQLEL